MEFLILKLVGKTVCSNSLELGIIESFEILNNLKLQQLSSMSLDTTSEENDANELPSSIMHNFEVNEIESINSGT